LRKEKYTHVPAIAEAAYTLPDQKALFAKAFVNSKEAGLLTCNIFAILPVRLVADSGLFMGKNFFVLLTVARQFVILTRFPINLQLSKTFSG
jgi:hypothetical protein